MEFSVALKIDRMSALNVNDTQVLLIFKKGASVDPIETPGGVSLYFWDPDGHFIKLKTTAWDGKELAW